MVLKREGPSRRSISGRFLCLLLCALLVLIRDNPAAGQDFPEEYRPEQIHRFIHSLIQQKEYFRAFAELKRLEILFPGYRDAGSVGVTEMYLAIRGKRYAEVKTSAVFSNNAHFAIFLAEACFRTGDYTCGAEAAKMKSPADPRLEEALVKRRLAGYLMLGRYSDAVNVSQLFREPLRVKAGLLINYSMNESGRMRSPAAAAALGVVPGLGYLYAGQGLTGLLAFLVVAMSVLFAVFSFKTDNGAVGAVAGTIGALFYSGSVMGGYLSVKRRNAALSNELAERIDNELDLDADLDWMNTRHGIDGGSR